MSYALSGFIPDMRPSGPADDNGRCEICDYPAERESNQCQSCNDMDGYVAAVLKELADEGNQSRLAAAVRGALGDTKMDQTVGRYFRDLCLSLLDSHHVALWQLRDKHSRG